MRWRRYPITATALVFTLALSTASAPAQPNYVTLVLSPNPAPAWGTLFVGTGCGYAAGAAVNIVVYAPATTYFFPVGVDATGCMQFGWWTEGGGIYTITASQNLRGRKQTLMAAAYLTVQ